MQSTPAQIEPGQEIRTGQGMAEILLATGSLLRLGEHSDLTLEQAAPEQVLVRLGKGEAMVEAIAVAQPGSIQVLANGARADIGKPGLYDITRSAIAVYAGAANVTKGGRQVVLRQGHAAKTRNLREFQTTPDTLNPLFAWSSFRSQQLSLQSASSAQTYSGDMRNWHGPAWFWTPWSSSYTYLSASGYVNGPFGWPFYAPGHSHNYIPAYSGDSYLYGPPIPPRSATAIPTTPMSPVTTVPTVPLTAPGVPSFPSSRGVGRP